MMTTELVSWAVTVMMSIQPVAKTPWSSTYESSAKTIVKVSEESPLFSGSDAAHRTVALFLSLGWFEGRLNPKAKGDCKDRDKAGECLSRPASLCMFQVGRSNLRWLDVTEEQILEDFEVCTRAAHKMIKISFGVCRGRPSTEILGHYASGGETCGGIRESLHRVNKALWIFQTFPVKTGVL
jgi:hypothetical protein